MEWGIVQVLKRVAESGGALAAVLSGGIFRAFVDVPPRDPAFPFLVVRKPTSTLPQAGGQAIELERATIEVHCLADTAVQAQQLRKAARAALDGEPALAAIRPLLLAADGHPAQPDQGVLINTGAELGVVEIRSCRVIGLASDFQFLPIDPGEEFHQRVVVCDVWGRE